MPRAGDVAAVTQVVLAVAAVVHDLGAGKRGGLLAQTARGAAVAVPGAPTLGIHHHGVADVQRVAGVVGVEFGRKRVAASAEKIAAAGPSAAVVGLLADDGYLAVGASQVGAIVLSLHENQGVGVEVVLLSHETWLAEVEVALVAVEGRLLVVTGEDSPTIVTEPLLVGPILHARVHGS